MGPGLERPFRRPLKEWVSVSERSLKVCFGDVGQFCIILLLLSVMDCSYKVALALLEKLYIVRGKLVKHLKKNVTNNSNRFHFKNCFIKKLCRQF